MDYNFFKKNFTALAIAIAFFCGGKVFAAEGEMLSLPILDSIFGKTPTIQKPDIQDFQSKIIRVLLSNNGAFDQKEISVISDGENFVTSNGNLVTNTTSPIKIQKGEEYFLIETQGVIQKIPSNQKLIIKTNNIPIKINNFKKAGKTASYLGEIEISASKGNNVRAINIIDIEDYIKGVVPNEMPVYFGLEALKAQAISARGYAYRDATYKTTGYDVCDTTGSQVYYGANS